MYIASVPFHSFLQLAGNFQCIAFYLVKTLGSHVTLYVDQEIPSAHSELPTILQTPCVANVELE